MVPCFTLSSVSFLPGSTQSIQGARFRTLVSPLSLCQDKYDDVSGQSQAVSSEPCMLLIQPSCLKAFIQSLWPLSTCGTPLMPPMVP